MGVGGGKAENKKNIHSDQSPALESPLKQNQNLCIWDPRKFHFNSLLQQFLRTVFSIC